MEVSGSINELAKQLKSMPKPAEAQAAKIWNDQDGYCDMIINTFDDAYSSNSSVPDRVKSLGQTGFLIEVAAYMRGEVDERTTLLRAMYLIAIAVLQGKPEPSDAEIGALQSAPLMDESKIPDIFRKAKSAQKPARPSVSASKDKTGASDGGNTASAPPGRSKPWWKIW